MVYHDIKKLQALGYRYAGVSVKTDIIGPCHVRRAAIYKNITAASLCSFRTGPGLWAIFYGDIVTRPFKDVAILP